jgi:hypothetical protein
MGANATSAVAELDVRNLHIDQRQVYIHASLTPADERQTVDSIVFLAEPRELQLPDPLLQARVEQGEGGVYVTLQPRYFAAYVWLSAPALGPLQWEDNFFHLQADEHRTVQVTGVAHLKAETFLPALRVRTLDQRLP